MIKYPITDDDYIAIYGKTKAEFCSQFDSIYEKGIAPRVDTFKRCVFNKIVPVVNKENLYRYYMSNEFAYLMLRLTPNSIDNIIERKSGSWYPDIKRVVPENKELFPNILDYGSGFSTSTVLAGINGYKVTMADIPHKQFRLVKRVLQRYFPMTFRFIELNENTKIEKKYDCIVSSEVLEHTLEPEQELKKLITYLKPNGWLYLSVFMDDMRGQDPSHLRKNTERYNSPEIWHKIVEKMGLVPILYTPDGVIKWWRKK